MSGKVGKIAGGRGRRFWAAAAALLAVAVFGVVFAASSGASLGDSTFEGSDGDMIVNHSGTDWASFAGDPALALRTLVDLTNSTSDNSFVQGTSEDDSVVTIEQGSIPNAKADLSRAYVASEVVSDQPFLYLAWERASLSGTVNFDFELNQAATAGWDADTTGKLTINRTEGDILITYDFSGQGSPDLHLLYWLTANNGHTNSDCTKSGQKLPCWGNEVLLTTASNPPAVGAVNAVTIDEPLIGGNATLGAKLFGEAEINLGDPSLHVFQPNTCKAFGSLFVNSRASDSFDSEMKDFIAPAPIHVGNCGSIELKKDWVGTAGNATLDVGTSVGGHETAQATADGADGTTGTKEVENGTYYMSESVANAGDYASSLACTDNGGAVTPGANDSVPVASGHEVVCTYTNTRKQGSIELKKHWVGAAGDATLKIGTAAGGSQTASTPVSGADGSTGAKPVDTGTYYVSESVSNAGDYTSSLACTDDGSPATPGNDGAIAVGYGHTVVCTYTNTRKGSIELKKDWVGTAGNATLNIGSTAGGNEVAQATADGSDGSTGAKTVAAGTYYVSESVANAGDYASALACTDDGSPATPGNDGAIAVADNHTVVCTYTNTRKQGTIELKKHWVGTAGDVTLKIGTAAGGAQVASKQLSADGSTGAANVDTGTYYVSESLANPGDYSTELACTDDGSPATPGSDGAIAVEDGHAVVCTYTNTRKQGSIELKKDWVGTAGDVTLAIGSSAGGTDVASKQLSGDGSTGAKSVDTGTYYVSESLANASDYTSELACTDDGSPATPGSGGAIAVEDGHAVVCTYTNTRKQGSIELKKDWVGTAGDVTLAIGSSAGGSDVASKQLTADGSTGAKPVETGTYYVSESLVNASDYTSELACTDDGSPVTPGNDGAVAVADNHTVVCTYTNTRKQGSIELKKHWVGTAGDVTLKIGTAGGGSDVVAKAVSGSDGSTGAQTVDTGTYYLSESLANAGDYTRELACTDGGDAVTPGANDSVSVADGHTVVCTYTNTHKGSVELKKHWVGAAGDATLNIGSDANGHDVAQVTLNSDGTTGAKTVDAGTYYVSESVANAGDYTSELACADDGKAVTPGAGGAVAVADNHTVVCTYTNTHKGSLELKKHWIGSAGDVTLAIGTTAGASNVASKQLSADGGTGAETVEAGTYYVSESVANAGDYTSSLACTDNGNPVSPGNDGAVAVADNHTVVCTYTNTRKQGSIELKKHWVGTAGDATLKIGTSSGGSQIASKLVSGADGSTGAKDVDTRTYYVSESVANAGDYTGELVCTDNGDAATAGNDGGIAVAAGHTVVCTYTNTRLGSITVVKNASGGNGTFAFTGSGTGVDASFSIATANGTGSKTFAHLAPGSYTVGEGDLPAGWRFSGVDCGEAATVTGQTAHIDLGAGDDVTCTFGNTKNGTIRIVKNSLGGDATFAFSSTGGLPSPADGSGGFQLTTSGGTATQEFSVVPGEYTVKEAAKDGWILNATGGLSCGTGGVVDAENHAQAHITVPAGGFVQCTYTNTKLATLIVKKNVDNSNGGGSKQPGDFTIHVKYGSGFQSSGLELPGSPAPGSSSGTTYSGLLPGLYSVTEDAVSGYSLTGNTCSGGVNLAPGATVTCTLVNTSAAPPPPPPPPPPAPKIDLSITKIGTPNPATLNGNVTWTMVVTNNGPNGATGVNVADPVPAGTTLVSVATTQGTCTGGAVVNCVIGAMPVGSNVTITLVTRAVATGSVTNTGTVVGNEQETNTANNTASSSVRVVGPFKPPVVYCTAVSVAPKQWYVGRTTLVKLRVVRHGKHVAGVRVRINGKQLSLVVGKRVAPAKGLIVTTRSAGNGVITLRIVAKQAGIVTFAPVASKSCRAPRVGVTGVFTPPVTG